MVTFEQPGVEFSNWLGTFVKDGLYWNPEAGPVWKAITEYKLVAQTSITGQYLSVMLSQASQKFLNSLVPCTPKNVQVRTKEQEHDAANYRRASVVRYMYQQ